VKTDAPPPRRDNTRLVEEGKSRQEAMKRKLTIFSGALLLSLALCVGTYAYTYSVATTTLPVTAAGSSFINIADAPAPDQPDWQSLLPSSMYSLEVLRPVAAGDETYIPFQSPSEGEHWDKVDEETPDDGDTTVTAWLVGQERRDLYEMANHSQGSGDIAMVTVYYRFAGYTDGGDHTARARAVIKTNGTVYESPQQTTEGSTYVTSSFQWTYNPSTGQPWTWDEVDQLQAGVSLKGEGALWPAYCTQVYVAVGYELPPIIDGAVPSGELFTVTPDVNFTGDMMINIYLTNTGNLNLAYRHLNMKLYVADSLEAVTSPYHQVLNLENGVAVFNIEGGAAAEYTVQVIGGGYNLISGDVSSWGAAWSITPEFYCEVTQR